jgi:hypothetical protein
MLTFFKGPLDRCVKGLSPSESRVAPVGGKRCWYEADWFESAELDRLSAPEDLPVWGKGPTSSFRTCPSPGGDWSLFKRDEIFLSSSHVLSPVPGTGFPSTEGRAPMSPVLFRSLPAGNCDLVRRFGDLMATALITRGMSEDPLYCRSFGLYNTSFNKGRKKNVRIKLISQYGKWSVPLPRRAINFTSTALQSISNHLIPFEASARGRKHRAPSIGVGYLDATYIHYDDPLYHQ